MKRRSVFATLLAPFFPFKKLTSLTTLQTPISLGDARLPTIIMPAIACGFPMLRRKCPELCAADILDVEPWVIPSQYNPS